MVSCESNNTSYVRLATLKSHCRLRQLRRLVGTEVTAQLVSALILSRLDYCNALLAGLLCSTIQHLQRVENAAARLVCDLRPHDHVTPALKQLHWLPIKSRIVYKLCLLMHNIHKIEEKLLWRAYRNSPTLFRTVPSPTPCGLPYPKIGVHNFKPKLQWVLSQERVKLRTANFADAFTGSIRTKAH